MAALLSAPWIEKVVVVVAPDDLRGPPLFFGHARVVVIGQGGATRRDSVLAGLQCLAAEVAANPTDWVLVHDAARPGLTIQGLERLRALASQDDVGGLLALPIADTVKRAHPDRSEVAQTIDRSLLWAAQTPQMFRVQALRTALVQHPGVTDEASAIEAAGGVVRLVEGERGNFKVTTAADLELMKRLLEDRS